MVKALLLGKSRGGQDAQALPQGTAAHQVLMKMDMSQRVIKAQLATWACLTLVTVRTLKHKLHALRAPDAALDTMQPCALERGCLCLPGELQHCMGCSVNIVAPRSCQR